MRWLLPTGLLIVVAAGAARNGGLTDVLIVSGVLVLIFLAVCALVEAWAWACTRARESRE